MLIKFILLLVAGYLLGSIHAGYLLPKWLYHIDIREHGTGKIGASNVMRVTSTVAGDSVNPLATSARGLWRSGWRSLPGWVPQRRLPFVLLPIIGHNWPVFLNFKGGSVCCFYQPRCLLR
jgi:glycerol-3-phosphate acyltransferase PlsY